VRRRRPAVPAEHMPPAELLRFEEAYWADLVDGDPVNAPEWASLLPEARFSAAIWLFVMKRGGRDRHVVRAWA